MRYRGSCHCGGVAFEVEGEIGEVTACNCSICRRKGSLLWFVPPASFTLRTSPEAMSTYTFNKNVIQHHFCAKCGIHPFGEGELHGRKMVAVNVRCLEDVEVDALKVRHFNGQAL